MALFGSRPRPEEVFTPRSPSVNDMYVSREHLERSLTKAIDGAKNIIVTGESGSGKTWLYKKVFEDSKVKYEAVNLASASLKGGLDAAFKDKNDRLKSEVPVERARSGVAKFAPAGIGAEGGGSKKYAIGQEGSFETLLKRIREKAGSSKAILVYENLEQIIDNATMLKAVADTIILLDDDDMSKYNVKICIVGVPTDIKQMLVKAANVTTIANRVIEVSEVARLTSVEAKQLMQRGFEQKLKCQFTIDKSVFYKEAAWKTDRIAQHVHEYCLAVAQFAVDNDYVIDGAVVAQAESEWLLQTLSADYVAVEHNMNARKTTAGRRNQTLYSLGACDEETFKYTDIEEIIRLEFPNSTQDVKLNIAGNLAALASGAKSIIRRTPKGDAYRFISPKYRMCLRTMLLKTDDERVEKISQGDLTSPDD